ncbi:MAG: excisionase family DNA-binding protein [Mycobacterium sp.]|uniref:excisionase family DNA-binding protein n=1 Tax=Mycobacterium sp. TaxID=1785 RepID=UPI003F9875CF
MTFEQGAEYLNTSVRFVRRLISERRIAFHKFGAHVRLSIEDLDSYAQAGRVAPITATTLRHDLRAS